jgi:monoamine oxidase
VIEAEILIVGGGFAGLAAAGHLRAQGRTVAVFEARDRVGGRVHTIRLDDGTPIDLGGQWAGPTQDRLYALARECGVRTFATYGDGQNVLFFDGKRKTYEGTIPRVSFLSLLNVGWAMRRLDRLAKRVDPSRPWMTKDAAMLDHQTLATMLERNVHLRSARKLLDIGLETLLAADAGDVSLLHAAFYVKSGKGLAALIGTTGGAQQDRFEGGLQSIADRLAADLGDALHSSSPVREIIQSDTHVELRGEGFIARGRRVVVAIPPALAGRIRYSPKLPSARDQLTQRMPMGSAIKCMAIYDEPFWRAKGLSGQAVGDVAPVHTTFDNSPPSGRPGILMGFIHANAARSLSDRPAEARRKLVLNSFARYFGPEAFAVREYVDKSWAEDEWSRGCYGAYMPPGVWTSHGHALARPVGRIHWAGTETASEWNGYIEGALASGERVAREILAREAP